MVRTVAVPAEYAALEREVRPDRRSQVPRRFQMTVRMRARILSCLSIVLLAPPAAFAQDAGGNVAAFAKSLPGTTIDSSKAVPAKDRLPAFCEVHATISPVPGSHIGAVYRLPEIGRAHV